MVKARMVIGAVLLLVICAMLVAACGGDDDEAGDDGGNGDGATATAQPTDAGDDGGETPAPTDEPGDDGDDGDDGDGGGVDTSEACDVITQSEVEEAFGVSMMEPELIELPDVPLAGGGNASVASCSYVAETTTDSFSFTVYSAPGDEEGVQAFFDLACQNKESVDVGDEACWYSEAHTEIQMRIGGTFLDLFITTLEGDSTQIATELAEKATARLG
jgi:hypothetical protein